MKKKLIYLFELKTLNFYQNMNQIHPNIIPDSNQNMDLNLNQNMNQINPNINLNTQNLDQTNENMNQNIPIEKNNHEEKIEDILDYINEPKMILKFSNISTIKNGTYITVKLPKSITKSDLYSIAKKYQTDYYSNIILSCNNYLLKEDDTPIGGIEEGSIINIIENIDYPDESYYNALMNKNQNFQRIKYFFKVNGELKAIEFPKNIKVSEMVKAAFSKLKLNSLSTRIDNIDISKNSKIVDEFYENSRFNIYFLDPLENHWKFGKIIIARVNYDKGIGHNIAIGVLNSINRLIYNIELMCFKKVNKIIIANKEFFKKEIANFSLKSLGINENFICEVELEDESFQ